MNLFKDVERILLSPATNLEELSAVVGLTAEQLFNGENFCGVDLSDEPIDVLLRINADFTGAILSAAQKRALRKRSATRKDDVRQERHELIWKLR